jgi:tetratricopeptide (TPR) repeat protein
MVQLPLEEKTVKARQVVMRVTGAMLALVAAVSVEAQTTTNTQRPLRPGQTKGPNFLVPVFRSSERGLGMQVSDVVRDRLMSDNLMTSMWVIPKKDLEANLSQSGYSASDALSPTDLKQLAVFVRAEEYVDAVVSRGPDGALSVVATLNLPRGEGMEQPLAPTTGARPGEIAARMSGEIEKARKQIKGATDCMAAHRQRQYDEARAHAQRAIKEFPNAVFARVCLLEIAIGQKSPDDELIKVAEEILTIAPENDRALEVVVDAYGRKATTDKAAYEDKYIAALEKLLLADPTNSSLQASVVRALATAGKFDKAKPVIDEAVKQSPGDPELIKLQWSVYRAMSDWKGAVVIGEEMIKHDTAAGDTLFFQQLVAAYLSDSQPQKAQEAAARGAAKHTNNATLWLSVIQLARRNGQLPQALEAVNRLLAIDPKNANAALQRAQIFSDMDQVDSMTVALRTAVDNGAPKETASGMILNKVNPWLQRWSRDTAKTVAEGERLLGVVLFADSLASTPATSLFSGLVQLQLGQALLGEAARTRNCEVATKGRDYVAKSQEVLPKAGRQFPDQTAGAMNGVMQLMPYGEQVVRAVCRPGTSR